MIVFMAEMNHALQIGQHWFYKGKDVRWPPVSLCPNCHRALPNGVSADDLKLSDSLVDKLVNLQRLRLDENAKATKVWEVEDTKVWDKIEDFDLENVKNFLIGFYWKPSWDGSSTLKLEWVEKAGVFNMTGTKTVTRASASSFGSTQPRLFYLLAVQFFLLQQIYTST